MLEIFFSFLFGIQSIDKIDLSSLNQNPTNKVITKIDSSRPEINAESGIILDANTGAILYKKNIHTKLPIASITKIMTAMIILEQNDLSETVTVPSDIGSIGGSSMYLQANEQISVQNLLYGLMVKSGNDAAYTLALHNSSTVEKFVTKMNNKAQELGLKSTNFANPMGFDSADNYSTAYDLAILTMNLYQNPNIRQVVSTQKIIVTSVDQKIKHSLDSTNALLDDNYYNVIGFKTGHTEQSGGCFVSYSKTINPKVTVVLGSNQRFHDTKILLDWAEKTFKYN